MAYCFSWWVSLSWCIVCAISLQTQVWPRRQNGSRNYAETCPVFFHCTLHIVQSHIARCTFYFGDPVRSPTTARLCVFAAHTNALWNKSNGSYDIKEFGTLPLIFSTSKYFRWKFQPWPSFFPHANIPDTWKRGQLSLEQMKKMEKVKVKSHLRYLAACSIQKKRWDIWRIFFSDFRSVFSP